MPSANIVKRIEKELEEVRGAGLKGFRDINVEKANSLQWTGLLVPESAPYNMGAFCVKIDFPTHYPFQPPEITFQTKIYHPNIDDNGKICMQIICTHCPEHSWAPAIRVQQVLQALVALLQEPDFEHILRPDLGEEFKKDKKKFMENAEEFTKKYAEKLPSN